MKGGQKSVMKTRERSCATKGLRRQPAIQKSPAVRVRPDLENTTYYERERTVLNRVKIGKKSFHFGKP